MSRRFLIFSLLLASLLPGRANLGETVEQIVARYGKPTAFSEANDKMPFGTVMFKASGYEMIIFLLNTKEVGARISKLDKSALADAEMQGIMATDTDGTKWTPVPSTDPTCEQWTRADKATVLYDKTKHMLIFTSPAMAEALKSSPPVPASPPAQPATPAEAPKTGL